VTADVDAERLTLALAAARLGDWSWDAETDVVTFSPQAATIFNIPPGPQMTWTAMRELLHPDDRERARIAVEQAIADHTDYVIEYCLTNTQPERWVSAVGRPMYGAGGHITRMIGVVRDITDDVRTREMLERQRELLREQAESLETINRVGQMLAAELNLDKLVQALTDAATEVSGAQFGAFFYNVIDQQGGSYMLYTLSGVPREHFASFPMPRATALFGPTFRGEGVIRINDVRQDPRYGNNPPYAGMPNGHLPVRSYLAVPVISRSGEVIGGLFFGHSEVGVFTERAERLVVGFAAQAAIALDNARLFESAKRARQAAEDANRLKDEFLATVSHELRTPLNAMLGWARLLRTAKVDQDRLAKGLETIERNARAQQEIIEDLLDVSRIISGKLRLEVQNVAFSSVVEAAVDTLRPAAVAKGISLHVALTSTDDVVLGDDNRLQQIVWNLLSNAIKFTPRGGHVQVTLRRVDSQMELVVADTGRGIAAEFLPHVFDRFRQSDSGTTRTSGGLGLGLAIVRHLVEMHGGTVSADSPGEGLGASFTVRLPLAVLRSNTGQTRAPAAHTRQPAPAADPAWETPLLAGLQVLVVDDEADTRELVREVLCEVGAEVRTAASATEAWALVRQWSPDVILSDIGMPNVDGLTFISRLREEGMRTPAAALTAYARSADRVRALSAGYQAHLAKPAEPAELIALVASLAGRGPGVT
jgi:signal transduction histidine kinase